MLLKLFQYRQHCKVQPGLMVIQARMLHFQPNTQYNLIATWHLKDRWSANIHSTGYYLIRVLSWLRDPFFVPYSGVSYLIYMIYYSRFYAKPLSIFNEICILKQNFSIKLAYFSSINTGKPV